MELREAWTVLGRDPDRVFEKVAGAGDVSAKVAAAIEQLDIARSLARRLMAVHHPDKNAGDPEAAERFMRVQEALKSVEENTARFKARADEMGGVSPQRDVFIEIVKT